MLEDHAADFIERSSPGHRVHEDAKALKTVILKRKWYPKGENSVLPQKMFV